ncbi:efflux RND transporter permease subunit [Chenggangzhangella methanolivorans]|uniref:Efflux pump membrane transporter n=1 Tax=Chenggangzhangella methanolivorans TaxID=1437009 RepID=A0A9E6R6N6_9HYPH|nr:efflux RND transporter permease subunit [Chenggangzhangella methanolivorans]QZN98933.1 efflux RND transporter permease subunit [Chenggangzhangella methanolivorans]
MFAKFFIERPVLANVIALLTILIGAIAFLKLPVAQYPDVTPPTVQVTARYPGASAKTLVDTVALPIERQVNGAPGMLYMQSTNASDGAYTLTVTFEIGTDADKAETLVKSRVDAATAQLPSAVQTQGVNVRKRSTAILAFVTLSSEDPAKDSLFLSNYASINLRDPIARVPGVGDVSVFGAGEYAMRVWLDPDRLQARGLKPSDVVSAIQASSQTVPGGQVGMPPAPTGQGFQTVIDVSGRLDQVGQFEDVIVKSNAEDGSTTRVRDVARVELGSKTYAQVFRMNGRPSAALAISQLPEANALETADRVEARMAELSKSFPPGLTYEIPFNTSAFVDAAVRDVYKTLIEACVIVFVVILLFLQDLRAVLVPATTVPVTIIGAFAAMAALGFTINMSTLFALVLAIGIVVDDAIVIVEGAARHLEKGLPGPQAAEKAMDELFGPIMGVTLVLIAVFLPAAFLPGLTGQLYQQFALVIAATAIISAINAVTLKPVQAALWMRPPKPLARRNLAFRLFDRGFSTFEGGYVRLLERALRVKYLVAAAAVAILALGVAGLNRVPAGFLPIEDQGYLIAAVQLPAGASLERTDKALADVDARLKGQPGVANVITVAGVSPFDGNASLPNAGVAYVMLTPWDERGENEDLLPLFQGISKTLSALPDGLAVVVPPPSIQGVGNTGGFTMMVELTDGSSDFGRLSEVARAIANRALADGRLQAAQVTSNFDAPQLGVSIDRAKAVRLGVSVNDAFEALSGYLGSAYVNQFTQFGQVFQVYVQAEGSLRGLSEAVSRLKVPNASGDSVPLSALASVKETTGPSLISLYNLRPAATIVGRPQADVSSGEALTMLDRAAAETLPAGTAAEWTGVSYQERLAGGQVYVAFGLALLLVYFVLAGQYGSWIAPMPVIVSAPLALCGTVATLLALGLQNTLYTQIGLVLLIALAAKNAILIVEYARELRAKEGRPLVEAALTAGRLRFRPILMTSIAFILGMIPLVLADGAGANASKSIGVSVVSGMAVSTALSVFVVPALFVIFQQIEERLAARKPSPAQAREA